MVRRICEKQTDLKCLIGNQTQNSIASPFKTYDTRLIHKTRWEVNIEEHQLFFDPWISPRLRPCSTSFQEVFGVKDRRLPDGVRQCLQERAASSGGGSGGKIALKHMYTGVCIYIYIGFDSSQISQIHLILAGDLLIGGDGLYHNPSGDPISVPPTFAV